MTNSNSSTGKTESTGTNMTNPPTSPVGTTAGGKSKKIVKYGTRRKVFNGTAEKTRGGLTKKDLIKNSHGRIVSLKRHTTMRKRIESD